MRTHTANSIYTRPVTHSTMFKLPNGQASKKSARLGALKKVVLVGLGILLTSCNSGSSGSNSGGVAMVGTNVSVATTSCLTGSINFNGGTVWYVSGSVSITNNCSSVQSLSNQSVSLISQDSAKNMVIVGASSTNATSGVLNNWWVNGAPYTLTFTLSNGNTQVGKFATNIPSGPVINAGQTIIFTGGMNLLGTALYDNSTAVKTFAINGTAVVPTPTPSPVPTSTPSPIPTVTVAPTPTPIPTSSSSITTGVINFHFYYGASPTSPEDSITLDGDNYTDLIMSNYIAGVMYGHLILEETPGMQFNKDYLYGSLFGQLLQENQSTEDYSNTNTYIAPLSLVGNAQNFGVMGVGQGGPYQINNYAVDMVNGSYAPAGFSMINYAAIQKNIGYTMATASSQHAQSTPPSFNNKYYGPMLTAYFHFNDYRALEYVGGSSLTKAWVPNGYSWTPQWQPYYYDSLITFKNLPNNFLDILLNIAYNQGFYGNLFLSYSKLGATATAATVTSVNSYSKAWGGDTYQQYPYQVHNYLDQLYDNPTPSSSNLKTIVTYNNHVGFGMRELATVFSNVMQTLAYTNSSGNYVYISATQANTAFTAALAKVGVASTATLDLSNASQRAQIYSILENAIGILETNLNTNFSSTTLMQL